MICEYYAPPEKDIIRLKWGMDWHRHTVGEMNISMSAFFPCSQETLKKLLKITDMDEMHGAAKEVKTLTGQIARFEKLKDITQQWRDRRGDDLWQQ